jgi:hypothetical protein
MRRIANRDILFVLILVVVAIDVFLAVRVTNSLIPPDTDKNFVLCPENLGRCLGVKSGDVDGYGQRHRHNAGDMSGCEGSSDGVLQSGDPRVAGYRQGVHPAG